MLLDKENLFWNDETLSTDGAVSDSIDMWRADTAPAYFQLANSPIELFGMVTGGVSGTSPTIQLEFVQADDAVLGTNLEVLQESDILAPPVAGDKFSFKGVPRNITKRYVGLRVQLAGTSPTATVTAGLAAAGIQDNIG